MSAPGLLWIPLLAACGFLAGFVGAIVVNPTSNSAPLIGIFITGPVGLLLGIIGYVVSRWFHVGAGVQWSALCVVCVIGSIATVLNVMPAPAIKGDVLRVLVERCGAPRDERDAVLARWQQEVAQVTWATPAPDWRAHMIALLEADTGVVVDTRVVERIGLYERQKPWNRGQLFAARRAVQDDRALFYDASGTCATYHVGRELETFVAGNRPAKGTEVDWPPARIGDFIGRLTFAPVPEVFRSVVEAVRK